MNLSISYFINLTGSRGNSKLKRLQNKFSPFTVNPIKTEFTDVLGVSKPEQGMKHVSNMTQTNNETLGPMVNGRNIHRGHAQTSPTANASEINFAERSNKSLHLKQSVNVGAGNKVVRKRVRKIDTKLISERSIENDEYNLNLDASALHDDYIFGKGWDKQTATIPEMELAEVVA